MFNVITKTVFFICAIFLTYETSKAENVFLQGRDSLNGKIRGVIIDKDNNSPLSSAAVQLLNPKDNSVVSGTETGTDGKFSIENIPFGTYTLKVEIIGYSNALVKGISLSKEKSEVNLEPI